MQLVGSRTQQLRDFLFDASGTIASGETAQLLLPERKSTSFLLIQNLSSHAMNLEFGSARATATITNGVVTSCSVTNAGFGFSIAPIIEFFGGGNNINFNGAANSTFVGCGQPTYPSPSNVAKAHCVMTGTAPNLSVASIVIDYGGSGYVVAPFVFIRNSLLDPNGCAIPSATSGILLPESGGQLLFNGTCCPTDPIAIYGTTTSDAFVCKWMP